MGERKKMPRIREEVRGREVGYHNGHKYIWSACTICGKERWVALHSKGKPVSYKCGSCAKIRKDNPIWNRKEYDERYYKENREWILKRKSPHRHTMEGILGRELKKEEVVHHIDMDKSNNDPGNLYAYTNKSRHSRGHWSLNKLVKGLLRDNIIEFENGRYYRILRVNPIQNINSVKGSRGKYE